jgi:hypothetical protein
VVWQYQSAPLIWPWCFRLGRLVTEMPKSCPIPSSAWILVAPRHVFRGDCDCFSPCSPLQWNRYQDLPRKAKRVTTMTLIESIETIPVKVPLEQLYKGSYYKMRNRCTIITKIRTSSGVVGCAYNNDSDEEQSHILPVLWRPPGPDRAVDPRSSDSVRVSANGRSL